MTNPTTKTTPTCTSECVCRRDAASIARLTDLDAATARVRGHGFMCSCEACAAWSVAFDAQLAARAAAGCAWSSAVSL